MSSSSGLLVSPKGITTRLIQAGVLALLFALLFAGTRVVPEIHGPVGTIAAVGFLLLAGTLTSELVETIGLPHLTGYMLAGVIAGPYVLHLVDHQAVEDLSSVNALALALIALAGGAELKLDILKKGLRSLAWATLFQVLLVMITMAIVFLSVRSLVPFVKTMPLSAAFGVALLWAVLAIARSPSATLGILSQTKAKGPLATYTLAFVMTSDVVVVILLAITLLITRPLLEPGSSLSTHALEVLGRELLASVALGTSLGLILALYMRLIGKQLILVLIALGFGATEVMRYLRLDALLSFLVAGFVVQNLSKQGEKFLHAVERTGGVVYVLFFATAGAHLDIPLFRFLWPVALLFGASRALITWVANRLACRLAKDAPVLTTWGWSGLVSQAGLALGVGVLISRTFPRFGDGFRALTIATVAINEVIGPVLFKFALDRAGETSQSPPQSRASLTPWEIQEGAAYAPGQKPPRSSLPPDPQTHPSD